MYNIRFIVMIAVTYEIYKFIFRESDSTLWNSSFHAHTQTLVLEYFVICNIKFEFINYSFNFSTQTHSNKLHAHVNKTDLFIFKSTIRNVCSHTGYVLKPV
jgi:hypothetical protein